MKTITGIALALIAAGCMQAPQADLEGPQGMREAWQAAFDAQDAQALAAIYAEDGAVLPPNGETVTGRAAIADFWAGFFDSGSGGTIEDSEAYASGDLGYKVGSYTLTDAGGAVMDEGKYVEVWREIDGEWQLHRDIFNSNRPATPAAANRVVVMAEVDDATAWERGFRTHGELLGSMSQSVSYFGTTEDDWIAVYSEPEDLERYMEVLESPDTAEAMESDGVDRDTVRVFVLDGEFRY